MLSCFSSIRATRVRRLFLHYFTLTEAIREECYPDAKALDTEECYLVFEAFAQHVLGDYFYTTLLRQRRLERNVVLFCKPSVNAPGGPMQFVLRFELHAETIDDAADPNSPRSRASQGDTHAMNCLTLER